MTKRRQQQCSHYVVFIYYSSPICISITMMNYCLINVLLVALVVVSVAVLAQQQKPELDDKDARIKIVYEGATELASYQLSPSLLYLAGLTRKYYPANEISGVFYYRPDEFAFKSAIQSVGYRNDCDGLLNWHMKFMINNELYVKTVQSQDLSFVEFLGEMPELIQLFLALRGCEESMAQIGRSKIRDIGYWPTRTKFEREAGLKYTKLGFLSDDGQGKQ